MRLKRRQAYGVPKNWSKREENLLLNHLRTDTLDIKYLKALFPKRSLPSIRSKVRKLRIKYDLFGESYRGDKGAFTTKIAKKVKPKIVFEAYAGAGHQTFRWTDYANKVYACELMKSKFIQFTISAKKNGYSKLAKKGNWDHFKKGKKSVYFFSGDVIAAAAELHVKKVNIDTVDLDTCGSTLLTLPTILTLLKPRYFAITHGEFHSMRFQRQDVLRRLLVHRDIRENPLPLDVDELSNELDKAVKVAAFRAHNETKDSFWPILKGTTWLGNRFHGMLRRYYKLEKPRATSDCINKISK
ncbi:MAG: hypothetical protein JNK79_20485 [Chitinophagaceae bacterium]|nr:hypothetical protein [Chitinophagaceae bacterium]